ncbi:MBL fold metallo-hydrolase [Pseudoalteromonas sp. T1lg65]|uniref:MBL fold metallo-hydrolase n=1 Tax=Pseudoalteromonas sp. T1lg65 TaxID=2077101 RepID=UPI003F7A7897
MKYIIISTVLLLSACSNPNIVKQAYSPHQVLVYSSHEGYEDRFSNHYKKPEKYPVNCTENCYPKTELIKCEQEMEQCKFVGTNPVLPSRTGFEIQWLGHATFVVKTPTGEAVLVDPVRHQFDWPVDLGFKLTGGFYRNEVNWPNDLEQQVDGVVYSHIHYDHFSIETIESLNKDTHYFTPLGFAEYFPDDGYTITEMPWFTSKPLGGSQIHFVPAHHFSSRVIVPFITEDNNATLWGGWVLESNGYNVFYAGDTGYSEHIGAIAERFDSFDICLMPIASYFHEEHGEWYRKVHMTPEDALYAANELNCKVMIPWGHGNASWKMGDKSSHAPLFRLLGQYQQLNTKIPLIVLNEGEKVSL